MVRKTTSTATTAAQRNLGTIGRETAATRRPRSQKKTAIGHAIADPLVDLAWLAEYCGVSKQKAKEFVGAGYIPEHDLGPFCKRYRVSDIEAFVQSRRREATALLG